MYGSRVNKLLNIAAGLLASFCIWPASSGADLLLRVRPHVVVVPESEVKLSQLVDTTALSEESRQHLAEISISKAPKSGERQELSSKSLMDVLRSVVAVEKARSKGQKVHVILPKSVIIDTLKRDVRADEVAEELTQAWQPLCPDCQLVIEAMTLPKVGQLRDWTLNIKAELPRGSFSVPLELIQENGSSQTAFVSGRLITKRKVPVSQRILAIGERLQPEDVVWEYRDTSYSYDGVPTPDELKGKHVKQGLRAGDILFMGLLEKEKAIRRGELVSVHSKSSGWEISINMVAQQDAFIGDTINLKNPKTNSSLSGEVVGQGEVELR